MTKKYNMTDVNVKKIDRTVDRSTFNAICGMNHLTPASEAAMENLLVPGSVVVPTTAEVIERNSPEFVAVMPDLPLPTVEGELEDAEPTADAFEYDGARASL